MMAEGLSTALALPGVVWVLSVTFVAGIVYGFAGFGAALIFMPVATAFLAPTLAVGAFSVSALISLVTVVPKAVRHCNRIHVGQLVLAAVVMMPLGLYALATWEITLLRWLVLLVAAGTLTSLVFGWRRKAGTGWRARFGIGGASGLVGGATGLVGPIAVLFQLSSTDGPERGRANTIVFLTLTSLLTLPLMWGQGILTENALWLGVLLIPPYGLGSLVGQALFDPEKERLYRLVAYSVIAAAIVGGLPVWG